VTAAAVTGVSEPAGPTATHGARFGETARAAGRAVLPCLIMVVGAALAWPEVQPEVYLIGLISGLVVGLIALAIVIVYRANRIINFAAADMGSAPATLAFLCFAAWGWPWWLVSLLGLPVAALVGVVVEFAFLRRFARAPRLIATVATIGVAQIFIFLSILMPTWFPDTDASSFPALVSGQITIGNAVFGGADLNVVILVPIVLVGLVAFFRFSVTGVAIRAAAERADRASLLGIPVRRLQMVVWGLAGLLAYLAIWLRSGYQVQNLGGALDPTLLLTALGAAVIGRMERMPTVVLAAIGLNIVDSAAFTHYSSPAYGAAIRAAIIAVALLVQRADPVGRLADAATSTWQATQEIRRIPAELRGDRAVRLGYVVLAGVVVLGLVLVPVLGSVDVVSQTTLIAVFAIVALSLVILTGWSGQVSLGQMGFVGLAGAVTGSLTTRAHWDVGLALLAAGAAGAALTVVVGLPTLRARGLAFAIMTLAFSVVTSTYLLNPGYSPVRDLLPDGPVTRTRFLGVIDVSTPTRFYVLTVAVLVAVTAMAYSLRRSRVGRVLVGVRDNERAAQAFGVGPRGALITSFAISGFFAGIAGGLFVLQQNALDASNFSAAEGLRVFSAVVVGGLGSIGGAVLGAAFVKATQYFMPAPWDFLASGLGLLLVLLVLPGGLGAACGRVRDELLRLRARRADIRVPSLVADTRIEDEAAITTDAAAAAAVDGTAHADDVTGVVD